MEYYLDPHVHTHEVSPCGWVPAAQMVQLYKNAGYSAVCVTDHYYNGYFKKLGDLSWKEKTERYCRGYYVAKEAGEKLGLKVLFGQEMRFFDHSNDFLVYGISPEDLLENPELYQMTLAEYREFAHARGAVIFQAHPFRAPCAPSNPAYIDGIEIYNGHPDHNSRNNLATDFQCRYAQKYTISGSDFHRVHHLARGGVVLPRIPEDEKDFIAMIQNHEIIRLVRTRGGADPSNR